MIKKAYIISAFLLTALAINAQDLYTSIDVLRPGCFVFPQEIKNVLVVNNSLKQPDNYGHQTQLSGQLKTNVDVNTDSAILYFLTSFSRALADKQYFDNVDLLEKTQNKSVMYYTPSSLTALQVDHLRKMYDADAVIVLNRLLLSDILEDYLTTDDDYYAYLEVHCVSVWHIFLTDNDDPRSLTLADTLIWENRDYRRSDAIEALPDRRNALLDMAIYSAESTVNKLLPHWEQRDRYFYTHNNRTMKAGMDAFYHKQWDEAIDLWYEAYQSGNNNLKARAAANMAATFEIEGDLNSALYWAQQAVGLFYNLGVFSNSHEQYTKMVRYTTELQQRIKEEEELEKQL